MLVGTGIICDYCGAECLRDPNGCSTGYAHTVGKASKVCFHCAEESERHIFQTADKYTAYHGSGSPEYVTTWTGGKLARIVSKRLTNKPCAMGGTWYYIRAIAPNGTRWWGYSAGNGCYCRLYRYKGQ